MLLASANSYSWSACRFTTRSSDGRFVVVVVVDVVDDVAGAVEAPQAPPCNNKLSLAATTDVIKYLWFETGVYMSWGGECRQ